MPSSAAAKLAERDDDSRDGTSIGPPLRAGQDSPDWVYRFAFAAEAGQLANVRRRVAGLASHSGLHGRGLFELNLAVGEALSNAVEYGSPRGARNAVTVVFAKYGRAVAVEVSDEGGGFSSTGLCWPGAHAARGRGILFMRTLADEARFTCGASGTSVVLTKALS